MTLPERYPEQTDLHNNSYVNQTGINYVADSMAVPAR